MSSALQEQPTPDPSGAADGTEVVDALRADVAALSEGKLSVAEIDPEGHLFDYGYLSSLTAVMFLSNIEERFGVEIEDLELVEELTTLNAVAARIRELR